MKLKVRSYEDQFIKVEHSREWGFMIEIKDIGCSHELRKKHIMESIALFKQLCEDVDSIDINYKANKE